MRVKMQNSKIIQNSFEGVETIKKGVAGGIKKAVEVTADEVAESLGLKEVKVMTGEEKAEIEKKDREKAVLTRQNLARINQEIVEIRKKKERKQEQKVQTQRREEAVKQEKKKESPLMKIIKSQQGSKEAMQRAGG